jgi:hypothetical protein
LHAKLRLYNVEESIFKRLSLNFPRFHSWQGHEELAAMAFLRRLGLVLLWFCVSAFPVGMAVCIASLIADHQAMLHGAPFPNPATNQIEPLVVCHYHGPCWTVYVTRTFSMIDHALSHIAIGWIGMNICFVVVLAIFGVHRKKSQDKSRVKLGL